MGWIAIYRSGGHIVREEDGVGRPVYDGNEGELSVIAQEDFDHKVAIDLINGVICLEYESLGVQNGTIEIVNPGTFLWICEGETNIVGEYQHINSESMTNEEVIDAGRPDGEGGWIKNTYTPLLWRPIWFTRMTGGIPTKVIGAQTTTPELQGGRNVKKMISLFADGRVGID